MARPSPFALQLLRGSMSDHAAAAVTPVVGDAADRISVKAQSLHIVADMALTG